MKKYYTVRVTGIVNNDPTWTFDKISAEVYDNEAEAQQFADELNDRFHNSLIHGMDCSGLTAKVEKHEIGYRG